MSCFEEAPEFVGMDNRQRRSFTPVSVEQMEKKHPALLPRELVEGKSVLDLGCCLAATGHWCLSQGAASYVGVELQQTYADSARALMGRYHPGRFRIDWEPIESWLEDTEERFDVVAMLGALYAFTDYYSIVRRMARIAKEAIVIEALYPNRARFGPRFCGVEFVDCQRINLADEDASLSGRGTRLSPSGLSWLMKEFGFESVEGLLYPVLTKSTKDVYNDDPVTGLLATRYLMRFRPTTQPAISLSEDLRADKRGTRVRWHA